ncbi:MAG: lysylphosphatidylglycerol synthase transmembrane domain-containing protein [Candidatus Rokuibacteriota bacterium]
MCARGTGRALGQWGVAVLVSGGLLAYLFVTREIDPRAIGPLIGAVSLPGVLAFLGVSLAALVLRTLRYWLLLGRRASLWPLTLVTLVRNLFVDLVPARAGAAASYLYLVTARLGLPVEAAIASFILSFVLDTLALAPLLLLAVLVVGGAPLPPAVLVGGSLLILFGSIIALLGLAPGLGMAARLAARLPGPLRRAGPALARAAAEVRRLEFRRVLAPALGLSLLLRVAKYGAYYCLLQALLVSQGHGWWSLDFIRVFLSVTGAELAASLPLPTIASLGPYEAAGALGFEHWLGLDRGLAALAATAFHVLSQVHDYGLGLLALLWIMAPWAGRPRACKLNS